MTTVLDALTACGAWVLAHPAYAWPLVSALVTIALKPRSPAQYAAMAAMRPVWFWSRFAPLLQLVGALGLDPVKALSVLSKVFTGKQDSAGRPPTGGLVVMLALACALTISACGVTPSQAKAGADAACTILKAFADSPEEEAICATAPELVAIAAGVLMTQPDAGAGRRAGKCTPIPTTAVCASDPQLAAAIRAVKAVRQ